MEEKNEKSPPIFMQQGVLVRWRGLVGWVEWIGWGVEFDWVGFVGESIS